MAFSDQELFDILNEDGTPSGRLKPRALVHRDGDLHGASHIFVTRKHNGIIEVLLQKRSKNKDSFPSCLDTSSAGHLDAGESFDEAAQRELSEELGLQNCKPRFLFIEPQDYTAEFYGQPFHDREIDHVYLLELDQDAEAFQVEKSEIESVQWMSARDLRNALERRDPAFCVKPEEFFRLIPYLEEHFGCKV